MLIVGLETVEPLCSLQQLSRSSAVVQAAMLIVGHVGLEMVEPPCILLH
jgi:hypothetical protein